MLHLRLSLPSDRADALAQALRARAGVRRLVVHRDSDPAVVTADVEREAADGVVALLAGRRVPPEDYVLAHLDVVAPKRTAGVGEDDDEPAWIEVLGEARANARPVRRYLTLMAVAGVIAALGVIDRNTILVIGAMAASPDLLPLCAVCVGLVDRRVALVRLASATLLVGLLLVTVAAAAVTVLLDLLEALPAGYELSAHGLGTLATIDEITVLVALAAGVAAVLAFETRASAAVGVAISVTTIPASAYIGVGAGVGEVERALGALGVLGVNLAALVVSGTLTLAVQRRLARRRPG